MPFYSHVRRLYSIGAYIPRLYLRMSITVCIPWVYITRWYSHVFIYALYLRVCICGFILCVCICAFVSTRVYLRIVFTHLYPFYSHDVCVLHTLTHNAYNNSYILTTSANFICRDLATENSRLGHALR